MVLSQNQTYHKTCTEENLPCFCKAAHISSISMTQSQTLLVELPLNFLQSPTQTSNHDPSFWFIIIFSKYTVPNHVHLYYSILFTFCKLDCFSILELNLNQKFRLDFVRMEQREVKCVYPTNPPTAIRCRWKAVSVKHILKELEKCFVGLMFFGGDMKNS